MTELKVGAHVVDPDGTPLGRVDALVVDPTERRTTHLVVSPKHLGVRRLVPVSAAVDGADPLRLSLDRAGVDACEAFDASVFNLPGADHDVPPEMLVDAAYFTPYASMGEGWAAAEVERIPKGDVTLRRLDEVLTSDGTRVGHVDELVVDASDGHITHVVLRQGHLLRRDDDVVVPLGRATFEEGRVRLDLDLPALEALPKVPVRRHGTPPDPGGEGANAG